MALRILTEFGMPSWCRIMRLSDLFAEELRRADADLRKADALLRQTKRLLARFRAIFREPATALTSLRGSYGRSSV